MRRCFRCKEEKGIEEFYRHRVYISPNNPEGYGPYCRTCRTAASRAWKLAHPERAKEWSDRTRAKWREQMARHRAKHPERAAARNIVNTLIQAHILRRPARCERCGQQCKVHAHHSDYARPLWIEWVCVPCHKIEHGACEAAVAASPRQVVLSDH